jgi:hypothetical protein
MYRAQALARCAIMGYNKARIYSCVYKLWIANDKIFYEITNKPS